MLKHIGHSALEEIVDRKTFVHDSPLVPTFQSVYLKCLEGYCSSRCKSATGLMQVFVTLFQKAFSSTKLPGRGIRAFAAFLHTHLPGTVIRELRLDSRKKKPIRTKPFCKQFLSPLPYTLDILCGLNARFSFTLC